LLEELRFKQGRLSRIKEARIESTELLKKEWEQVKRGEKWFRYTKWAVLILVGILTIIIIYAVVSHKAKPNEVQKNTNKTAVQMDNGLSTMSNGSVQRTRQKRGSLTLVFLETYRQFPVPSFVALGSHLDQRLSLIFIVLLQGLLAPVRHASAFVYLRIFS
jgi:cell division protein FtsL